MPFFDSGVTSGVEAEWKEIANALTDEFGVNCKLIFAHSIVATGVADVAVDPIGKKEAFMPSFGGRTNQRLVPVQQYANIPTGSGLVQLEQSKTIIARVYPANEEFKELNPSAGVTQNIWKMICDKKYLPDLIRCTDAVLNDGFKEREVKAKLMMPPVPYGLGAYVHTKSYWVETNG